MKHTLTHTLTHLLKLASTTAILLILGFTVVLIEGCAAHPSTHTSSTFAYVCYSSWSTCA
jgi:hypothetical protein